MRKVSESLAGRVGILRLDGLTPAESTHRAEPKSWLHMYLDNPSEFAETANRLEMADLQQSLPEYLWRGQLPALIDFQNEDVPAYLSSYVQTYVERDIRMMADLSDLAQFERFLRLCGALTGQEIFQSQLGRELGITIPRPPATGSTYWPAT